MTKITKLHRVFFSIAGLCLFGFGVKTILTEKISAEGGQWRGAGWLIQGDSATFLGITLCLFGAYVLFIAITEK